MDATLRDFKLRDIARVRDMFCEAFELDCYSQSRFVMRHLLDHYLCGYLMETEYAVAAISGGEVEGFLLGCASSRRGRRIYRLLRAYHRMFLPFSHGGRAYMRCKRLIEEADASLRRAAPVQESELILFVVRSDRRGSGTGRYMLNAFRDWLKMNGIADMQLFTDDYCDVDYYRARGYEQLGERDVVFAAGIESKFYMFTIPVDKIGNHTK